MRTDTVAFTDELAFPWAKPPITATYATFRARLRAFGRRLRRSQFARDLSRGYRRSAAILGCVAATYAAIVILRGLYIVAAAFGPVQ